MGLLSKLGVGWSGVGEAIACFRVESKAKELRLLSQGQASWKVALWVLEQWFVVALGGKGCREEGKS